MALLFALLLFDLCPNFLTMDRHFAGSLDAKADLITAHFDHGDFDGIFKRERIADSDGLIQFSGEYKHRCSFSGEWYVYLLCKIHAKAKLGSEASSEAGKKYKQAGNLCSLGELQPMSIPAYMKANRAPFPWRSVLLTLLLLVVLACGFFLVRYVLYLREVAKEKAEVDRYGVPMLLGPVRPGGPFFGEGDLADLSVTDNGWNTNQLPDGTTTRTIFVTVHNKSGRTWDHVQAIIDLSNDAGKVGTKRAEIGTLAPGQDSTVNLPYLGRAVTEFQVVGVEA